MPLIFDEQLGNCRIALWLITESVDELASLYMPKPMEGPVLENFKCDSRKREWLSVRILLSGILGENATVDYMPNGKPFINGYNGDVSISHSTTMAGVILSRSNHVGIDIEQSSRSVERVISRFLSQDERSIVSDSCRGLNLWCAKEAVFKAAGEDNIDFQSQIRLSMKSEKPLIIDAELKGLAIHRFDVKFIDIEEHTIAWIG